MAWLRLILLAAGALFLLVLVWVERRRTHQSQDAQRPRVRAAERAVPGIDWSAAATPISASPPLVPTPPALMELAEDLPGEAVIRAAALPPTEPPPLRVDWPAEPERRIATLRILPARQDRLAGRALRQGLAGCGFRHGQLGIFHLPTDDGRVLLSAASLVRPGVLDPATMDFERYAGISLFAVLPGPLEDAAVLERLATVAEELAGRMAGLVQDESGAPFTGAARARWRERCMGPCEAGGAPAEPLR